MTNDITIQSGKTVHITIDDENGAALPPDSIAWVIPVGLQGLLTVAADSTGLNMTCAHGASAAATVVTFTYQGGGVTRTIDFNVTLGKAAAGPLEFTSP